MLHADPEHLESVGHGAEWFIWSPESIPALSEVLNPGGCLASAIVYETKAVSCDQNLTAFKNCGFPVWRHLQRPGDAVFIPPRHPHQVRLDPESVVWQHHSCIRSRIMCIASRLRRTLSHHPKFLFYNNFQTTLGVIISRTATRSFTLTFCI